MTRCRLQTFEIQHNGIKIQFLNKFTLLQDCAVLPRVNGTQNNVGTLFQLVNRRRNNHWKKERDQRQSTQRWVLSATRREDLMDSLSRVGMQA